MIDSNYKIDKYVFIVINIFWFLIIWLITDLNCWQPDDLGSLFYWGTDKPINSFLEVFSAANWYYTTWGGRWLSGVIIMMIVRCPYQLFAVLNSVIYCLSVNMVCIFVAELKTRNSILKRNDFLFLLYLLFWFLVPSFGEITWAGGSITSMWMDLLIILFLFFYWKFYRNASTQEDFSPSDSVSIKKTVGLFLVGLCAGLSNEGGACMVIAMLILFCIWGYRNKIRIPVYLLSGIIAAVIGSCILMFAPGNFARTSQVFNDFGTNTSILFRIARGVYYGIRYNIIIVSIAFACMAIYVPTRGSFRQIIRKYNWHWIIYISGTLSWAVLCFSPAYSLRCAFLPFIIYAIAAAQAIWLGSSFLADSISGEVKHRMIIGLRVFFVIIMICVLIEIATGVYDHLIQGTAFDRKMIFWFTYDPELL